MFNIIIPVDIKYVMFSKLLQNKPRKCKNSEDGHCKKNEQYFVNQLHSW